MSWWKNSPFTKPMDRWRVRTEAGYVFDRRIFIGLTVLIVLGMVAGFFIGGMPWERKVYLHCPENAVGGRCSNPLYQKCSEWYCQQESFVPGFTYGEPPGALYDYYSLYVIGLCVLALIINHYAYNKQFEFNGE